MKKNELTKAVVKFSKREGLTPSELANRAWVTVDEAKAFLSNGKCEKRTVERMASLIETDREMPPDHPGRVIRELRESLGWSRDRLVKESGVSKTTIKFAETGRHDSVRIDSLQKLHKVFAAHFPGLELTVLILGDVDKARKLCRK